MADLEPCAVLIKHLQAMRLSGAAESYVYCRFRRLHGLRRFIGKNLLEATPAELTRWRASLDLTPDAVLAYVSHARMFYQWAIGEGLIDSNPAARLPLPRRARRLPRPMAETDLMTALIAAPRDLRLMLVLAGWLGLRACEIAGLRWESVRMAGPRPLMIVAIETTKGWRERALPLSAWIVAELERFGPRPSGYVFRRRDGMPGPNKPHRISQRAGAYLHEAGVSATLHQARHRFGTMTLGACHDLRTVQEMMGHSSPETTAIYTAFDPVAAAAAIDGLPVPA
jgi:integrase/recombinase XerC